MTQLSGLQVAQLAQTAGIPNDQLPTSVAIAWAESGLRTDAVGINYGPRGVVLSRDRGLWQINDRAHPGYNDACAFDPACNASAMSAISSTGRNWHPWTTFNTGAYQRFMAAASLAVYALLKGAIGPPPTGGPAYVPPSNPGNFLLALKEIRDGSSPIGATVRYLQRVVDEVMDQKYGYGHRTGPIVGSIIK